MAIAAGMTLGDIQTDLVANIQEHLSFRKWLTQEVPWYQSYMKSGLTMYLLYYMLQVRTLAISQQPPTVSPWVCWHARSMQRRFRPCQRS